MKMSSPLRVPQVVQGAGLAQLNLTLAISEYEHVRDLTSGLVKPQGIVLTPLTLPIEEIAFRHFQNLEFDLAETSFAKFISLAASGDSPIIGIPVFPARLFRHSAIYVRKDRGISAPKDLEGKVVGIPEWAQTAGVYIRGMLTEHYGVQLNRLRWIQASVNAAGRVEKVKLNLPRDLQYDARPDTSLNEMLLSGEIDCAITARPPDCFLSGDPAVVRLFPDYRSEEEAYYEATGIFPIAHLICMRRSVFEAYPWAAARLVSAFDQAKNGAIERMSEITTSRLPLPWGVALVEEIAARMGGDLWPYGLEANRTTLEAFCRFAHDQHITAVPLAPEDLFPQEVIGVPRV